MSREQTSATCDQKVLLPFPSADLRALAWSLVKTSNLLSGEMALGRWFVLSFCPRGWGLGWGWGRLLIEGGGEDVLKIEDEPGAGVVQALFHPNFLKDTIQLDEKDNLLNGF